MPVTAGACPYDVPLTGTRSGRKAVADALSRGREMPPAVRLAGMSRVAVSRSHQCLGNECSQRRCCVEEGEGAVGDVGFAGRECGVHFRVT
jgi:hypothetical protein